LVSARSLPIKFSNLVSAFERLDRQRSNAEGPLISGISVELSGIEIAAAQWLPSGLILCARYASAAALSLLVTALIVAGNQRVFPRAVGIPSSINPSAIA
jgi:hypothetical protein